MRKTSLFTLAALASLTLQTEAKWSRLPSVDEKPVSIAGILSGTTIYDSNGLDPANALLMGDPVRPVSLKSGKSEAVLKFAKQAVIKNVSFVNDGIEGKVALATSTDGKAWSSVDNRVFSPSDRLVKMSGGATQGRYLRMQFDLVRGGVIRSFQAIGSATDANYTVSQSADGTGASVNFATGIGGGRLLYISPELFGNRNEAAKTNVLEFPESDEKYRTAVYDLGQVRSLNEFGSVHSPRPVRFSVYAFENLPEKEDWRGRLEFDPTVFDTSEPVARAEDSSGAGFIKAKPGKPIKSRYIALRWEPDFNPPAFTVHSTSVSGNADVTYSDGDVEVKTTTDSSGNTNTSVSTDGQTTLSISTDSQGNVSVSGSDAGPGANGGSGDASGGSGGGDAGGAGGDSGQAASIGGVSVGAPSASGAGLAGPSENPPSPGN